tara:strand:+ start:1245 stop:2624 length:1380 start_codon:yes stop_codon:yes gene_type:complete
MTNLIIKPEKNDIQNYGIIYTPENLVNQILDLIPPKNFENPTLRWLDIGAGTGAFTQNLYNRLFINLEKEIQNSKDRRNHIIKNMLFMVEIYPDHITELQQKFGTEANIINKCFLSLNKYEYEPFDFIIGNPPYNIHGQIKTPTNSKQKKTDDGKSIYVEFVKKSLELLYPDGFLNLIIPSLWLKPDKAGLYKTLTNLKIHKLHCLSTNETNKSFNYQAQTPTCFFLIENIDREQDSIINIYDKHEQKYTQYELKENYPIPTHGITIINKLLPFIEKYGYLKYYKTNTSSKKSIISINPTNTEKYKNIKTCVLENQLSPNLVFNYSNIPQHYHNQPKLILAHKMYGFPYLDISGIYGISTRDNYIISSKDYDIKELKQIQAFLSTKFALFIFSTTNYRMRYLERYAFQLIPDIIKIPNFPQLINQTRINRDKIINEFFNFSHSEQAQIENLSKDYKFFI